MSKGWLIAVCLVLMVALLGAMGCDSHTPDEPEPTTDGTVSQPPEKTNFNLIFNYGVMARNKLDTFQGTYTKDMVIDPPITVELSLSEEEMDSIHQKMVEIDFFNYPDNFSVSVPPDVPTGIRTPYPSYYFKVEYNSKIKELWWNDQIVYKDYKDERADRLSELVSLIRSIVESKEEYKKLPEPRSAYL